MAKRQDADLHKTLQLNDDQNYTVQVFVWAIMDIGSFYYCLIFFTSVSPWSKKFVFYMCATHTPCKLWHIIFIAFRAKPTT